MMRLWKFACRRLVKRSARLAIVCMNSGDYSRARAYLRLAAKWEKRAA